MPFDVLILEEDPDCDHDYVEFKDGEPNGSNLMRRLCGETLPTVLRASGKKLFICL